MQPRRELPDHALREHGRDKDSREGVRQTGHSSQAEDSGESDADPHIRQLQI